MRRLFSVLFKRNQNTLLKGKQKKAGFVRPNRRAYEKAVKQVIKENRDALIELSRR